MTHNHFDIISKSLHTQVDRNLDYLKNVCKENPVVDELVTLAIRDEILASPFYDGQEMVEYDMNHYIAMETRMAIYNITKTDDSNFFFEFSRLETILFFISNYILDDSEFSWYIDEKSGTIEFKTRTEDDYDTSSRNPQMILDAARVNAKYYMERDNVMRSKDFGKLADVKVDSSEFVKKYTR
jgi:hypothetical protein